MPTCLRSGRLAEGDGWVDWSGLATLLNAFGTVFEECVGRLLSRPNVRDQSEGATDLYGLLQPESSYAPGPLPRADETH
jgi:hypothetical protein